MQKNLEPRRGIILMPRKSEPQSTNKESDQTRKKSTSEQKKGACCCDNKKSTIFLATTILEGVSNICTRLGREVDTATFKTTYNKLNKLYEELS